jgi:hypothetical protein
MFQHGTKMTAKVVEVAIPSAPAVLVVVSMMEEMH